jgi:hypothetical protein
MTTSIIRRLATLSLLAALASSTLGCSSTVREGRSPAYLIIESLAAAPGNEPDKTSSELSSDVTTLGTVFEDLGSATFSLALKDVGAPGSTPTPTSNNFVTVNRYHVTFRRSDGRNTPGVDVPYAFDGAGTVTVGDKSATLGFVLVRTQAKMESPLRNLQGGGAAQVISTIADITFYGRDQVGNEVAVTGSISVNFADWADPES